MTLSLVICVLLILVIVISRLIDWTNGQGSKYRMKKYDSIMSAITDQEEGSAIEEFHKNRWEYVNSMEDDLESVIGKSWKDLLLHEKVDIGSSYRGSSIDTFSGMWNVSFEIWMSHRGYIPLLRTKYNLNGTIVPSDVASRACKEIEKNIRSMHPDLNMRLCCGETEMDTGRLVWNSYYELSSIKPKSYPWDLQ